MDAQRGVEVVEDPRYAAHAGPAGHPERPERLSAVAAALDGFGPALARGVPRPAEPEELLSVHDRAHVERVRRAAAQVARSPQGREAAGALQVSRSEPQANEDHLGSDAERSASPRETEASEDHQGSSAQLDPDTFVSAASYDVALLAAGGCIDLALRVARGAARAGFAAVRPPGHHAEGNRAMGFCLFNNAAIAARAVQREAGVERVLVLDWDVHHGNGTQHTFETDPSVLYVSTHQYPFYPGTGAAGEIGVGRGEGATLNVPMPAGCGDAEYVGVFQRVVAPAARAFRPDYWIVSCGFDAHEDDPLAAMRVTQSGYAALTAIVRALADELSGGRMLFVLEGGYSLRGLREGTGALVAGLLAEAPAPPRANDLAHGSVLETLVARAVAVHGARIPGLGAPGV